MIAQEDGAPPPGTRRWLIACDESGTDGQSYYGFGTLWMNWQRRGDFSKLIAGIRAAHEMVDEIKWKKTDSRNEGFYRDLIEAFFKTKWLTFHCMVVRRGAVRKELHGGDWDLARRKHFAKLLTNKIRRCVKFGNDRPQTFRVLVDPIASRYKKADEVIEIVSNNVLAKIFNGLRPVDKVFTRDSKETPAIQLCDLLLGCVMAAWQQKATKSAKLEMTNWLASHLGWEDLQFDTFQSERKFNIWYFYDPTNGARDAKTRKVKLKYPL